MAEYGINNAYHIIQIIHPSGETTTNDSDIICMKGYNHADVVINIGSAAGTQVVTFDKMNSVGSAGTTELAFTDYFVSGAKIYITNWNGTAWTDDETVTGASLSGKLEKFWGDYMTLYDVTTGVVANETLTGGSSTATAKAVDANEYEDTLVLRAAASNTFSISTTNDQVYIIPITAVSLGDTYDCWKLMLAAPSSGTIEESATAILYKSRYFGDATLESGIYD